MTREPIFIRVDATGRTGYERYQRCLTLAAALQRRRRPTYFVSQLEPASLAFTIKRVGNDWIGAHASVGTAADAGQLHQEMRRLHPAAIIVDDADASSLYLDELAGAGVVLVSLDHAAGIRFPSALVINPLVGQSKECYEYKRGTQLLLGRRYALVRPEVRRCRPGRAQEPAPLAAADTKTPGGQFRALVALGEDDPHGRTLELVKLLLNVPRVAKVDMVVRREHPDLEALQAFAEENKQRVELALEPAEIAARIVRGHFALTGGGGWSLELACVGVPQLLLLQNEAHWPNAQKMEEEGCATCLGWHENVSAASIRQAVQNLLTDPMERLGMARCGRKLIDGRGPDRLVNGLEILLSRRQRRITEVAVAA